MGITGAAVPTAQPAGLATELGGVDRVVAPAHARIDEASAGAGR